MSQLPAMIGRYFVRKELGSGRSGQGRVFLALHPTLDRDVAIKIGHPGLGSVENNELLIAEGRVLSQLDHPHLAKIYDLDFYQGCPYLVMEFVRGKTVSQAERHTRFTPVVIAQMLAKVARGVAAAHARGIVHQDLKPDNIVLDERGEPRVIDFGMARLQSAFESNLKTIGGTAQYMAPEQAAEFLSVSTSGDADPRRDVFSLGAVLYFLLTGAAPFQGADQKSCLESAAECNFDRKRLHSPQIPFHLARICLRAMAKHPDQRPGSATELARQLESFGERQRFPRRLILAGTVVLMLAGTLGVGLALRNGNQPVRKHDLPAATTENTNEIVAQPVSLQKPATEPADVEKASAEEAAVEPIPRGASDRDANESKRRPGLFKKGERESPRFKRRGADD